MVLLICVSLVPMRKCSVVFVVMWPYGGSHGIGALQPSQLIKVYQCIAKPLMPSCNTYRCGALLCCHWIKTLMCLLPNTLRFLERLLAFTILIILVWIWVIALWICSFLLNIYLSFSIFYRCLLEWSSFFVCVFLCNFLCMHLFFLICSFLIL